MDDKLQVIVKESGLDTTKAQFILDKFTDYFQVASEWERRAREIVVTDASQTVDMKIAREGRLFLQKKRVDVEKARKQLKEQALREGQAIDGIARTLTALIKPIESYLEQQEKFVELKEAREEEVRRAEIEKRLRIEEEKDRAAQEEAEAAERERIRKENIRLRVAAAKAQFELKRQSKAQEEVKAEVENKAAESVAKAEVEKKVLEDKLAKAIECPFCHKKFTL